MTYSNVTVVIPSVNRPERLLRAVESVLSTTTGPHVVCVLEVQDDESRHVLEGLWPNRRLHLSLINRDSDLTTADKWNTGARFACRNLDVDYFVTGADDVTFEPGWLEAAFEQMRAMGGSGLVGFNEGPGSAFGALATHFLVSRHYAVRGLNGTIMPSPYRHNFTDMEATFRAKRDGRLRFAEGARIYHEHPFYDRAGSDEVYKKGDADYKRDEALFWERMDAGFPNDFEPFITLEPIPGWGRVAVGLRTIKNVSTSFLKTWSDFLIAGLRPGDRLIDIGETAGMDKHIAANKIVELFLRTDCDSLLMVDDDMIIPYNSLSRMRDNKDNWDFDIVQGFATHKTYPPHAVVQVLAPEQPGMPERLKGPVYLSNALLEDDSVVPVDAVGIAFTLVKRHVFESTIGEYGPEYTSWFDFGGHSEMEDTRFSLRCLERGYDMAVDTSAKIGHEGAHVYGWKEHQKFVEFIGVK